MRIRHLLASALSLAIVPVCLAQQSKLRVGDDAPALSVDEWVSGEGPGSFDADRVYVVEFWATWCGPCKQSIPHLNELHEQFSGQGLTILGISDEKPEVVKPWVQAKGSGMAYNVGIDSDKSMNQAWMEAAGQKGIPAAFVVGKTGKVVYIGHPLDPQFGKVVRLALSGRFDPIVQAKAKPILEAGRRAAKVKNWREAYRFFDDAIALDPKVMAPAAIERYKIQLTQEKNLEAAAQYGRSLLQTYAEDPAFLGDLADAIVTDPDISPRDFDLAKAAAAEMVKTAGRGNPALLAKLAAVQFHTGDVNAAIETQMEAWMGAPKAEKADFKRQLDSYRAGQKSSAASGPAAPGEPK
jgi:thiol-disulfide isomerase/thioredoxin